MKPRSPPKPSVIDQVTQLLHNLGPRSRKVILGGLVFIFIMAASITLLLAYSIYEPQITAWLHKSNPTQYISQSPVKYPTHSATQNPTQVSLPLQPVQVNLPTQTPSCLGASLQLGNSSWSLQSIQLAADGSITVPANTPGVAYWIQNLVNDRLFALSPTQENLELLSALQGGETATITWQDCNTATFTLLAPQYGTPDTDIFADESMIALVVYLPESDAIPGIWMQGGLTGETIIAPPTPAPYEGEVNVEISLLETSTSDDRQTIQVVISILNYGYDPITISDSDISLTPEGESPLALYHSDPILPITIKRNETSTIALTFPHPYNSIATIKIFMIEFDLEDY
jgi:hypothetical protein